MSRKNSIKLKNCEPVKLVLETSLSFKDYLVQSFKKRESDSATEKSHNNNNNNNSYRHYGQFRELQKVYKSYRTRRSLADCAVDVEELWWKALDFAALKRTSMLFFNVDKPKTTVSRWARAQTIAAKAGKELSKDEKAQKLALQHCLEAASPENFLKFFLQYPLYFGSS